MGKTIFAELDEITFNRIKKNKNTSGMIDEKKFFSKLNEGDSIVFSCRGKKIEAYLKKIKICDSIGEYLKNQSEIGVLEINSRSPIKLLSVMGDDKDGGANRKKVRVYEVDYHPFGEDDENENENENNQNGGGELSKIFEALIANSMNNNNFFRDDCED